MSFLEQPTESFLEQPTGNIPISRTRKHFLLSSNKSTLITGFVVLTVKHCKQVSSLSYIVHRVVYFSVRGAGILGSPNSSTAIPSWGKKEQLISSLQTVQLAPKYYPNRPKFGPNLANFQDFFFFYTIFCQSEWWNWVGPAIRYIIIKF